MTFEFDEIAPEKLETLIGAVKRVFKDERFRIAVTKVATATVIAAGVTAIKYGYKEYLAYREGGDFGIVDSFEDLM
jgi:hypothetical protein